MRRLAWLVIGLLSCAHNVPQDSATGADGKLKGATAIRLDHGEGRAKGIVTYPGGDRVDWKSIELPAGKHGTLDITMTYVTPRPHLHVAFDVFDQWSAQVHVERSALRTNHRKVASIPHARGTYFVRVYAPGRGDAGAYKLVAAFQEDPTPIEPGNTEIPDPPKLVAVPPPTPTCDTFDPKLAACADACPDDAPSTWKGCHGCRTPDVNNPACWTSMTCPSPPDRRVHDCLVPTLAKHFSACLDPDHPDPNNPRCDPDELEPVTTRGLFLEARSDGTVVTLGVGSRDHVGKSWRVRVLQAGSDVPLVGGDGQIIRISKTQTVVKVKLTVDQVTANPEVRLSPR